MQTERVVDKDNTVAISDGSLLGLYKTTNGGGMWQKLDSTPNYCYQMCWKYPAIAISPNNPDMFFAGGLGFYPSADGGKTWVEKKARARQESTPSRPLSFLAFLFYTFTIFIPRGFLDVDDGVLDIALASSGCMRCLPPKDPFRR